MVRHNGEEVLRTIFKPEAKQPRAYLEMQGKVSQSRGMVFLDV